MSTIAHPIHLLDRAAIVAMRAMINSTKGKMTGPDARRQFDEMTEKTPKAGRVTYREATVGGLPGWWCTPNEAPSDVAILYLHGGAFTHGSARAFRCFAGQIAARAKAGVFVLEYSLAPEHRFPTPVIEAQTAYEGLVELSSSILQE